MIFNAEKQATNAVRWIRYIVGATGLKKATLGISGGKDSYVAAALLSRALGEENVIGVLMPNGNQSDIADSIRIVSLLGIRYFEVNIGGAYSSLTAELGTLNTNAAKNIPPRLRMTTLYAVAANNSALVSGTTNASEYYVGYGTKFGDLGCDFSPLLCLTKGEVVAIGHALGLDTTLVDKTPSDGLGGGTDEEAFGFSYNELDSYVVAGNTELELINEGNNIYRYTPVRENNPAIIERIEHMHRSNAHKASLPPFFTFSRE